MDPPFYVLSPGENSTDYSTPNTSLSGSSHDTARANYHIQDVAEFAADLNNAAKSAFPNHGRTRYDSVNACLIRWEEDELGVQPEMGRLDNMFQIYGFKSNTWLIPNENSHLKLMSNAINLLRASDNERNLFIIYYAGHGRINNARQAEWTCRGREPEFATADWSAIQSLFAKAKSDVLILLDTCAAASSAMRSQFGVMEAIVACGFESRAPPPGEHSFTNTLIEVLNDWVNRPSFSASCLHTEILFQLKLKEKKKGREGIRLEWCVTPIHINYTQKSRVGGIELCRRNNLSQPLDGCEKSPQLEPSTSVDIMDIDSNESSAPLFSLADSGEYQVPQVLIRVGLEQNQPLLNVKDCSQWLEQIPLLAKWAKVEGVYPSYSTLLLVSVPLPIWNMLPDNLACSFIGYVTAPNLASDRAQTVQEINVDGVSIGRRGEKGADLTPNKEYDPFPPSHRTPLDFNYDIELNTETTGPLIPPTIAPKRKHAPETFESFVISPSPRQRPSGTRTVSFSREMWSEPAFSNGSSHPFSDLPGHLAPIYQAILNRRRRKRVDRIKQISRKETGR